MKFLTRINRNYIILFAAVLTGVTLAGYFILKTIILKGTKENLISKEFLIRKQIIETGKIPNLFPVIEVQVANDTVQTKPLFREIEIWNERENENELFLEYSNIIRINDSGYVLKLRQSVFENEDLELILVITLFVLLSSAFLISFIITNRLNKTVWSDFEINLHAIETFSLNERTGISLLKSDIEEFERLNKVIADLTEKLKSDYHSLKEFTENASHEIQTPLTIALLNLEEVLQQEINPDTLKKVVTAINAIKRLSSLNQNLALLTKIENRQFVPVNTLNIIDILHNYISEFEPLFKMKNIKVDLITEDDFSIKMNNQLAGIMISNLLSNCINHNIKGGLMQITVKRNSLLICNTGLENQFTDENIFNRFVKGPAKSYGLGLAIVKKICNTHALEIHYTKNELHCFTITSKS